MRLFGRLARAGGLPPGRRGGESGLPEPALQGAFTGEVRGRVACLQAHADEAGPPGRVLLVQEDGLVQEVFRGGPGWCRGVVVGRQGSRPALVEALEEVLHGAGAQAEFAGDGGGVGAVLVACPDELAQGQGDRLGHGNNSSH